MLDYEYISALVVFGKASAANLALLQKRVTDLFTYITLNNGQNLVSVALPGQHIAWEKNLTVQEEFSAVQQALAIINGQPTIIRKTYPVFW